MSNLLDKNVLSLLKDVVDDYNLKKVYFKKPFLPFTTSKVSERLLNDLHFYYFYIMLCNFSRVYVAKRDHKNEIDRMINRNKEIIYNLFIYFFTIVGYSGDFSSRNFVHINTMFGSLKKQFNEIFNIEEIKKDSKNENYFNSLEYLKIQFDPLLKQIKFCCPNIIPIKIPDYYYLNITLLVLNIEKTLNVKFFESDEQCIIILNKNVCDNIFTHIIKNDFNNYAICESNLEGLIQILFLRHCQERKLFNFELNLKFDCLRDKIFERGYDKFIRQNSRPVEQPPVELVVVQQPPVDDQLIEQSPLIVEQLVVEQVIHPSLSPIKLLFILIELILIYLFYKEYIKKDQFNVSIRNYKLLLIYFVIFVIIIILMIKLNK